MHQNLQNLLFKFTNCNRYEIIEEIQSLWSGYGTISRYKLYGGSFDRVVIKHVKFPDVINHPKGWNSDLSHQRKLKSYEVEKNWYKNFVGEPNSLYRMPKCYGVENYNDEALPKKIIFSGNSGIGKCTLAYHLSNYIFSLNEKNKYNINENIISNDNYSYNLVSKNTHPNFFLISSDDGKMNIQVSKIREMIDFSNKSSFNGQCKIIIIDNIEHLNLSSVNSLLKIIEEPNSKIYFFLIHNNKKNILDTLKSRCIKFNLFLNSETSDEITKKLISTNFYDNLNNDFKNIYNSPGDIYLLNNFFNENNVALNISIDDFLKMIIDKSLFKKNFYIKSNLSYFLELYFNKKINYIKSKDKIFYFYKYFLSKVYESSKYNLDIENVLIEFNGKMLNG